MRDDALDKAKHEDLFRIITELAEEVWVLRDRLTVLEVLLDRHDLLQREEVNRFVPEGALSEEITETRSAYVAHVFGAPFTRRSRAG